ncbi:MAG TPA: hypothetical protein VF771_10535 [Longimicrobiaceae bacterium]
MRRLPAPRLDGLRRRISPSPSPVNATAASARPAHPHSPAAAGPPRVFYLAEDGGRRRSWLTILLANAPPVLRVFGVP